MNVMYFSTAWCQPCKMFKPVVQAVSQELSVPVNFVNAEYDASLVDRYSITSVPTIIIADASGGEVFRNTGVMSREQLISVLSRYK